VRTCRSWETGIPGRSLAIPQFYGLNGQAEDLDEECRRYASRVGDREINLACIGIGENGHIAFNDPPVADFEDPELVKVLSLDQTCREQQVRDGAFSSLSHVPRRAPTLTVPAIMRSASILCVVPGQAKAMEVWKTLNADVSTACPATILRQHSDVGLHLDREAACRTFERTKRAWNGGVPSAGAENGRGAVWFSKGPRRAC
jgi:glucosamine-6-phosphate deaminase